MSGAANWDNLAGMLSEALAMFDQMPAGGRARMDAMMAEMREAAADIMGMESSDLTGDIVFGFFVGGMCGAELTRTGVLVDTQAAMLFCYAALEWMPIEERKKLRDG